MTGAPRQALQPRCVINGDLYPYQSRVVWASMLLRHRGERARVVVAERIGRLAGENDFDGVAPGLKIA